VVEKIVIDRRYVPPHAGWFLEADRARQKRGKSVEKTDDHGAGIGRSRLEGNGRYSPMVGVSACLPGWYVRRGTQESGPPFADSTQFSRGVARVG